MKFKISWPTGIILAIAAFIVFILSFVVRAAFLPKYDHHLISEEYYKDELRYQEEIDKLNKAGALKEDITVIKVSEGLSIKFPAEFDPTHITGTISFKRLSNDKIDFELPIKLETREYLLNNEDLVAGRWDIRIEWTVNNNTYLYKEKIMY